MNKTYASFQSIRASVVASIKVQTSRSSRTIEVVPSPKIRRGETFVFVSIRSVRICESSKSQTFALSLLWHTLSQQILSSRCVSRCKHLGKGGGKGVGAIGEFFASGKKGKMWWRYILVRVNGFINRISRNKIGWKFSVLDLKLVQQVQRYSRYRLDLTITEETVIRVRRNQWWGGGGTLRERWPSGGRRGKHRHKRSILFNNFLLFTGKIETL